MKNLKRVLSLALASVMVIGMMVVGTGAAFDDADKIQNKEAVDVLVSLGVISGKGDGSNFDPNGTLTRAEAAKIITYMMLGPSKADKLGATGVSFTDVPANHWAASYIGYCSNMGILAGKGNGTFGPSDELTGLAFGKMLLVALGYDAKIEKYTGTEWAVNVAVDMVEAGLALGDDAVLADAISRDDACLLAFNALTADMVKYTNKGTEITLSDGTKVVVGASDATKIGAADSYCNDADDDTLQFCEKYFSKLTKSTGDHDDFGRPAVKWFNDGKAIGTYTETPVKTYTSTVKEKDLFADLGAAGYTGTESKFIVLTSAYEDGVEVFTAEYNKTKKDADVTAKAWSAENAGNTAVIAKGDKSNIAGTGKGTITEVYKTSTKNEYKVVFINEYITKVTSITKATDIADRKINTAKGSFETEEFAKNDYVLVTVANGEIKSAKLAEKVENVAVDSYKASSVTANGVTYGYSNRADTIVGKGAYTLSDGTYTFYLDSCGNIIKGDVYAEAASTDYYKVIAVGTAKDDGFGGDKYNEYKVLDLDGTVSIVKAYAKNAASANTGWLITMAADDDNDGFMKFTALPQYDTAKADTAGWVNTNAASFKKTSAKVGALKVNNSTTFVLQTGANKFKTVKGLNNMDNYASLNNNLVVGIVKNGVAKVVYMDVQGKSATSAADELVYVVSTSFSTSYDKTAKCTVYTYTAVIDGELTTIQTKDAGKPAVTGLYKITNTADGYVTAMSPVAGGVYSSVSVADKKVTFEDGILTIDTDAYVLASDVEILMIDADDALTVDADADALAGDTVTGTFYLIKESASDDTIVTIYFDGTVK